MANEIIRAGAMRRGRTLDPEDVKVARANRENTIKRLRAQISYNPLDFKARRKLRKITT